MVRETIQVVIEYIEKNRRAFSSGLRTIREGMKRFRIEMLGVMFFGMGISRMFQGWLKPAMDAYGMFDLFNVFLLTTFAPTMDEILPKMLGVMEWFEGLPKPIKDAMGWIAIFGGLFGEVLFKIGMFTVGVSALIESGIVGALLIAFGKIGAGIAAIFGTSFIVALGLIGAFVISAIVIWKVFGDDLTRIWKGFWGIIDNLMHGRDATKNFKEFLSGLKSFAIKIAMGLSLPFIYVAWLIGTTIAKIRNLLGGKQIITPWKEYAMTTYAPGIANLEALGGATTPISTVAGGGAGGNVINYSPTTNISEIVIKEEADFEEIIRRVNENTEEELKTLITTVR